MRRASTAAAAAAVIGLVLLAGAVVVVPPASAGGGSVLVPDRDHYEPGDPVHLVADVRKLDLDWFGPYTVSLRPVTATGSLAPPGEDPTDAVVGRLVVTRVDPMFVRAEVTFVLPKLADGEYWVQHCNPGCTKNLGDLSSGFLRVGPLPSVPPTSIAPSIAPTTRVAIPVDAPPSSIATSTVAPASASTTPPDRIAAAVGEDDEGSWLPIALGATAAVLLVLAIGLLARRRGPRRVVTSRGTLDGDDRPDAVVAVALEPEPQRSTGADAASTIGSVR